MSKWRQLLPWRVRLLVAGVAATGLLITVRSFTNLGPVGLPEVLGIGVFGLLAAASHFRPTCSRNQQVSYSTVPAAYFALAMVLPRAWVAPAIIGSWLPWMLVRVRSHPIRLVEAAFNVSLDIIAAVTARDLHYLLLPLVPSPTLCLLVAALVFTSIQTLLVSAIVTLHRRVPWREVDALRITAVSADLLMALVGGIMALLYQMDPASLAVIFLPLGYLQYLMDRIHDERAAYLDAKTGLYNYRYIDERLPAEVERARTTGLPLSLIFADLDLLRDINNRYGHLAGDVAIKHIGSIIASCLRSPQFVARFGGEEFVMVLPATGHEEALRIAEQARAQVAASAVQAGDVQFRVTMSLGVATLPDHAHSVRDLIHAADLALYQAKAGGRNCVRSYRKEACEPCAASR